jgi:hypothetical protein
VATIAGRTFTVNQGQACSFDIDPDQQPVDAAGGTPTVTVLAPEGCGWTAASEAPWISIVSGAPGSGNGSVQIQVAANTGAPRTGTASIAGLPFTVTQAGGCSFVVAPTAVSAPADGLSSRVDVTADAACSWSASTPAAWITITAGSSGSGNGPVEFTIGPNAGPARDGVLTVAGHAVTVSQASGCAFALSATSVSLPVGGGPGSVTVTTGDGCAWTAVSQASWITVTPGAGAGTGTVQFTVAVNETGAARSGTIQIGGQTFTVNQE